MEGSKGEKMDGRKERVREERKKGGKREMKFVLIAST